MRRILAVLLLVVVGGLAWLAVRLRDRPDLAAYARLELPAAPDPPPPGAVTATFLGVSTVLLDDGETALLTDGFFSRPPLATVVLGRVAPDPARIGAALARAGVRRLAAVLVVHSHYDHAMDAPEVARRTGALLCGSESTANVARGVGFGDERVRLFRDRAPMRFGAFEVTPIRSRHFPHGMAEGEITAPLVPPARASAYREGGSWSLLVRHPAGTVLVQGSAGWEPGALAGVRADVVLLGVAGLGTRDDAYREGYVRDVVDAVDPRTVIPIHWDDFTLSLDEPLRPLPRLLDDFDAVMGFLARRITPGRRLALLPAWRRVVLFTGAAPPTPLRASACRTRPPPGRRAG